MSQVTDRTVGANPTGFDMRIELNNIIAALESDNSGSSEPLNPVAYMDWFDTSNATYYYLKKRNHDNTAWNTVLRYTVATKLVEFGANALTATQLATAININGVSFDGSASINIEDRLGTAIASAATTTLGSSSSGDTIHITGTTTITSFGASVTGVKKTLIFDGALTLTHNGTSLILPASVNIVTAAGDSADFVCENGASGKWRCIGYTRESISITELGYLDGVTSSVQTQINTLVTANDALKDVPKNSISAAYTLALTDRGNSIDVSTGGITITVPLNSAVAFPIGATVSITNLAATAITVSSSATLRQAGTANTGSRTLAAYGMATLRKVAADTWFISGAGLS